MPAGFFVSLRRIGLTSCNASSLLTEGLRCTPALPRGHVLLSTFENKVSTSRRVY
jgi:hypothetical protein